MVTLCFVLLVRFQKLAMFYMTGYIQGIFFFRLTEGLIQRFSTGRDDERGICIRHASSMKSQRLFCMSTFRYTSFSYIFSKWTTFRLSLRRSAEISKENLLVMLKL